MTLLVDGKQMHTSPPPVLRRGRVYIPVTAFRKIGLAVKIRSTREASVGWPESDDIVDFKAGVRKYVERLGEEEIVVTLPGTPFVHRGVLMVPLRSLLSDRDHGVALVAGWDASSRVVHIHRSKRWLRRRLEDDASLTKACPDLYDHVWLGEYVPVLPKREIARAEKLDASGNWQDAVEVLRSLVESRPFNWAVRPEHRHVHDEWRAYGPLGSILVREHQNEGEGYLYLGIGRAVNEDYSGAEEAFLQGAEVNPASADLQFAIGWAILRQERAETTFQRKPETIRKALAYFEKALEIDPSHERALRAAGHASLGLAYLESKLGGYTEESKMQARPYLEKAAGYFERLLQQTRSSPRLDYLLWEIYRQSGRQEEALEHYRRYAFAMSGTERRWRLRDLARMYEQAGKPEEAAAPVAPTRYARRAACEGASGSTAMLTNL